MNHRPVCVLCGVVMLCNKNDVAAIEKYAANKEQTYRIWSSDEYRCPKCGFKVLSGFGKDAYSYNHDEDFVKRLERVKREEVCVEFV